MKHTAEDVRAEAEAQIEKEDFRERVRKEKIRIREHVPFWQRVFPWTITIERRTK